MKRRIVLLLSIVFAVVSLGFSQTSGTTSTSTSTNTINATVLAAGGVTPHQLVQAAPGPIPGMFPGNALSPGACYPYRPQLKNLRFLTPSSIESMAKGSKLPHGVKPTLIDPDAAKAASYDGPIGVMEYDPTGDAINNEDVSLAGITMPGKPFEINEALLGVAVKALKKVAPAMQRIAVMNCFIFAEVTDTSSKGFGAVVSGTNGTGQIGGSGSVGWFHGKSSTEQQRHVVTTIYAMNGPYTMLTLPPPEPKRDDAAIVRSTPQPESKAPPVQTIRIEVVTVPSAQIFIPSATTAPTPAPSPAPTALDECLRDAIPIVNVYFGFDLPKVNEGNVFSPGVMTEDGPKDNVTPIRTIQQWLENHPSCKIDVVGYASHQAPSAYNNDLGERRAKAVFEALIRNEKIRGQVFEADSNGKETSVPTGRKEHNWGDRRVSFRIRGSDSSGR